MTPSKGQPTSRCIHRDCGAAPYPMRTPAWRAHRDASHKRSSTGLFVDLCEVPEFTLHCAPSFAPQRDERKRITILVRYGALAPVAGDFGYAEPHGEEVLVLFAGLAR